MAYILNQRGRFIFTNKLLRTALCSQINRSRPVYHQINPQIIEWRDRIFVSFSQTISKSKINSQQDLMELANHTGESIWRENFPIWLCTALPLKPVQTWPDHASDRAILPHSSCYQLPHEINHGHYSLRRRNTSSGTAQLVYRRTKPLGKWNHTSQKVCPPYHPYADLYNQTTSSTPTYKQLDSRKKDPRPWKYFLSLELNPRSFPPGPQSHRYPRALTIPLVGFANLALMGP